MAYQNKSIEKKQKIDLTAQFETQQAADDVVETLSSLSKEFQITTDLEVSLHPAAKPVVEVKVADVAGNAVEILRKVIATNGGVPCEVPYGKAGS